MKEFRALPGSDFVLNNGVTASVIRRRVVPGIAPVVADGGFGYEGCVVWNAEVEGGGDKGKGVERAVGPLRRREGSDEVKEGGEN